MHGGSRSSGRSMPSGSFLKYRAVLHLRTGSIIASCTALAMSEPLNPSVDSPSILKSSSRRLLGVFSRLSWNILARAGASGSGM